ncbi:hypothetical protein AB0C29_27855, partial [Actinoplanes sp. NPDC048791]
MADSPSWSAFGSPRTASPAADVPAADPPEPEYGPAPPAGPGRASFGFTAGPISGNHTGSHAIIGNHQGRPAPVSGAPFLPPPAGPPPYPVRSMTGEQAPVQTRSAMHHLLELRQRAEVGDQLLA